MFSLVGNHVEQGCPTTGSLQRINMQLLGFTRSPRPLDPSAAAIKFRFPLPPFIAWPRPRRWSDTVQSAVLGKSAVQSACAAWCCRETQRVLQVRQGTVLCRASGWGNDCLCTYLTSRMRGPWWPPQYAAPIGAACETWFLAADRLYSPDKPS